MKKLISGVALATLFSVSGLHAESKMYVGYSQGSGSGDRTYTVNNNTYTYDITSEEKNFKIGKQSDSFDKFEFEYGQHTLTDNDGKDYDTSVYKLNFKVSMLKLSYEEIVIPYWGTGIGMTKSSTDDEDGGLALHLELGVMYNVTDNIQLDLAYRSNLNTGSTAGGTDFYDSYSGMQLGLNYLF